MTTQTFTVEIPADPGPLRQLGIVLSRTVTMCTAEVQKLRHDCTDLITRAIQPTLWLLVFGQVFTRLHIIPTGIPLTWISWRRASWPVRAVHRDLLWH